MNNTPSKGLVAFAAVATTLGLIVMVFIGGLLGFRSKAVNYEESIKAQYEQNQNNYDNMWKEFREIAQVTEQYADDLKELYDNAMTGRYGEDGSQAMFQWLTEQNPTLSTETYTQLQYTIEAGRNSFETDQKELISIREEYAKLLRSNNALIYNAVLGYPTIDLDEYTIVTSEETDRVFEEKQADEINLFE